MLNWPLDRLRMLDANLDRACEGLRTAEDIARFHLTDAAVYGELAGLRRELSELVNAGVPRRFLVGAREAGSDVGRSPRPTARQGPADIAAAACRRAEEALRVIEELLRTCLPAALAPAQAGQPAAAAAVEALRYRAYEAEKRLLVMLARRPPLLNARLYFIVGSQDVAGDLLETARQAIAGGADIVQYREKRLADAELLENALRLRELCRASGIPLIVNDRPDIAMLAGADGVHVGHEDLPAGQVRSIVGDAAILGVSTHSPAEAAAAADQPVDYISVGPCFETPTKPCRPAAGLEYVRAAAEMALPFPFFAIGGIDASNVDAVLAAGARRIAAVRAIAHAADPEQAARHLKQRILERIEKNGA